MTAPVSGEIHDATITVLYGELAEMARELAAATAERDQARQMLADAPHGGECKGWMQVGSDEYTGEPTADEYMDETECDCWKAEIE